MNLSMGLSPESEHGRPGSHRAGECQPKRHAQACPGRGAVPKGHQAENCHTSACFVPREADQFRALAGFTAVVAPDAQRSSVCVGPPSPPPACCRGSLRDTSGSGTPQLSSWAVVPLSPRCSRPDSRISRRPPGCQPQPHSSRRHIPQQGSLAPAAAPP